jgi:hypothetical protein
MGDGGRGSADDAFQVVAVQTDHALRRNLLNQADR